jgi:rhamnogalacturonyl hydrolase YesR
MSQGDIAQDDRTIARWRERRLMASQTQAGLKWLRTHGWDTLAIHDAIEDLERCITTATRQIGDR